MNPTHTAHAPDRAPRTFSADPDHTGRAYWKGDVMKQLISRLLMCIGLLTLMDRLLVHVYERIVNQ